MGQVAIISRQQHDIESELRECVACLENTGIPVYVTHRGQGYAVLWADNQVISRGVQVLRNAGFEAAPLTRTRSLKLGHRPVKLGHRPRQSPSRNRTAEARLHAVSPSWR